MAGSDRSAELQVYGVGDEAVGLALFVPTSYDEHMDWGCKRQPCAMTAETRQHYICCAAVASICVKKGKTMHF
jgi:hypothetical protein